MGRRARWCSPPYRLAYIKYIIFQYAVIHTLLYIKLDLETTRILCQAEQRYYVIEISDLCIYLDQVSAPFYLVFGQISV